MYIKQDYDYKQLKQFIAPSNMELYELIENESMQDVFCLMVGDYYEYKTLTVEELNQYMHTHETIIKQTIKDYNK